MNWLENIVSKELIERCPYECKVSEKALKGITKGLIRTGGMCPCAHPEWDENTPHEDKLCPCKTFRETKDCHCNLYITTDRIV